MSEVGDANARVARAIIDELVLSGIREVCISPGSRSTPLVLAAAANEDLRDWVVTDERSAAFFALGAAREKGEPVLLICTSGTAAANYMPAVAEAMLAAVPLVLLTADRPPELRDCAAPQTIHQAGLYGTHVKWAVDVPCPGSGEPSEDYYRRLACRAAAVAREEPAGPVHLNLPFREPLMPSAAGSANPNVSVIETSSARTPAARVHASRPGVSGEAVSEFLTGSAGLERGVIVCGPRANVEPAAVMELAARLGWPLLADPLSGLRYGCKNPGALVDAYDLLLRDEGFRSAHEAEAVLQFGAPPVSKALGNYLQSLQRCEHTLVAVAPLWPDPWHRVTCVVRAGADDFCRSVAGQLPEEGRDSSWRDSWLSASREARRRADEQVSAQGDLFEAKVLTELVSIMPDDSVLHVGNSMPVRDLDTYVGASSRSLRVGCNRGANGIDGVLSTAVGAAAVTRGPLALVLGDLSFLHDIGGLQAAFRHAVNATVVVVDNDGGGVFSFLPQAGLDTVFEDYFATPHGLDIGTSIEPFGARLHRVGGWQEFRAAARESLGRDGLDVLVVPSQREENRRLHARIAGAVLDGMGANQ